MRKLHILSLLVLNAGRDRNSRALAVKVIKYRYSDGTVMICVSDSAGSNDESTTLSIGGCKYLIRNIRRYLTKQRRRYGIRKILLTVILGRSSKFILGVRLTQQC